MIATAVILGIALLVLGALAAAFAPFIVILLLIWAVLGE